MRLIDFFRIIKLSFYAPSIYIDVARKWKHWGLGLLLRFSILVSFISSILLFIMVFMIDINSAPIKQMIEQIPEMNVYQSKASFVDNSLKSPVLADNIIIDLDAKSVENHQEYFAVFSSHGITLNIIEATPITISYDNFLEDVDATTINADSLANFLIKNQRKLLAMILILGVTLGSLIYFVVTIIKILFYSSIASIFASLFKMNLDFKQLTRLAIIANIPSFIIATVLGLIFFTSNLEKLEQIISTGLYFFYFMYGISSVMKSRK